MTPSAGCTTTVPTEGGIDTTAAPSAEQLFRMVTETDPFEQWAQFPEAVGTVDSAAPHGPMARIFINAQVENAMDGGTLPLPDGSIIVKENLGQSTSEKAEAWTIMWKVAGFDADNNDWFWANITPDGEVGAEGRIDGCISCHSGAQTNDYVFTHTF